MALAALVGASAVWAEPAGVQFVATEPFTLGEPGNVTVELFNGSPVPQALSLSAEGDHRSLLTINVTRPGPTPPAERASFTVRLTGDRPAQGVTIPLLATSKDGTLARLSVAVRGAMTVPTGGPAPPTKLQLRGTNGVPTPLAHLPLVARWVGGTVWVERVGTQGVGLGPTYLSGDSGRVVVASMTGGKVTLDRLKAAGTYEGQLKSGDITTAVTLKVRDLWVWPLLLLVAGVLAAGWMERRLTRERPAQHLEYILETLKARALDAQEKAGAGLRDLASGRFGHDVLFLASGGDGTEDGYLAKRSKALLDAFVDAKADFERERFGPASDAVKDLDVKVGHFAAHLDNTVTAARIALHLTEDKDEDVREAFLTRLDPVLVQTLIQETEVLDARKAEVADVLKKVREVKSLDDYIASLVALADDGEQRKWVSDLRNVVIGGADVAPNADLKTWRTEAEKLRARLGGAVAPAGALKSLAVVFPPATDGYPEATADRSTSPGDEVRASRAPVVPRQDAVRHRLRTGDTRFVQASGVVVVLSGMAALYLNDDTFGTTLDYAAILLWAGATQQGINLVRRLLPGAMKALS